MVAKQYIVASILGVAALVGTCSNGSANNNGSCAATCANHYAKDLNNCPPLDGDGEAHFECVVKAQDAQEMCDSTCPNSIKASAGILTDGGESQSPSAGTLLIRPR
jgi:hypothetical protein